MKNIPVVFFIIAIAPDFLQADGDKATFIKKLENNWNNYEKDLELKIASGWNLKISTNRVFTRRGKDNEIKMADLFLNNGSGSVLIEKNDSVQCENKYYLFFLHNKNSQDDANKSWILKHADLGGNEKHQYKGSRILGMDLYGYSKIQTFYKPFNCISMSHFSFYFKRPYFLVNKINETQEGNDNFIVMDFTSPHESAGPDEPLDAQRDSLQSGTIKFYNSGYLLPQSYSVELKDGGGNRMKLTGSFQYNSDPLPLLIRHETADSSIGGEDPWSDKSTYTIDYSSPPDSSNERRFSLSYYGLPEPQGVDWAKPTPLYYWIGLAAGLFAGCFWFFRYLSQRSNEVSSPQ